MEERDPIPRSLSFAAALAWRFLVVVAATAVVVVVLMRLRLVVLPVIAALFLTTVLVPPARLLEQRLRFPPAAAAGTVLVAGLAFVAGGVYLLASAIARQFNELGDQLGQAVDDIREWLTTGPLGLSPEQIDDAIATLQTAAREFLTARALTGATLVLEIVIGLVMAFVLTFFFVKDRDRICAYLLARLGNGRRDEDVKEMGRRAWETLSGYLRGVVIISTVDAVGIGIGLIIMGVPLVVPLMVLTFMGGFFPLVGAFVAGLVAALVALVSGGVVDALVVTGIVILVQQVESNVLEPVVMARAVKLHPVVILAVLTAGGVVWGIVGAFLAVPIAAVAAKVGNYVRENQKARLPAAPAG